MTQEAIDRAVAREIDRELNKSDDNSDEGETKKKNLFSVFSSSSDEDRRPRRELSPQQKRCRMIGCGIFTVVLLLLAVILITTSIKKVEPTKIGLKYAKYKKQLDEVAKSDGLHTGPPGFRFIKFPATQITVDIADTCVSRDGLRVDYEVTFQYQMNEINLYPAVIKYRDFPTWALVVEAAGSSAIQHSCSDFLVADYQNKRGEIQERMFQNLRIKLEGSSSLVVGDQASDTESPVPIREGVYAQAISVQLRNVNLPEAYSNAVTEKQSAEEDIALAKNQRRQEITKAETSLLSAQEEARKILDTADNEAEVLLTEASLKAEETIFAFETEAATIASIKANLNLSTEGVLSYLTNNLLETVPKLRVTSGEPARLTRKEEL